MGNDWKFLLAVAAAFLTPMVLVVVLAAVVGPEAAGEASGDATDDAADLLFSPTSPINLNR